MGWTPLARLLDESVASLIKTEERRLLRGG